MKNNHKKIMLIGCGFILLDCLMIALSSIFAGQVEKTIDPLILTFYTFCVAGLFFNALNIRKLSALKRMILQEKKLILLINIITAIMWLSFFYSLKYIEPAISVAIFFGTAPITATLITLKQPKSKKRQLAEFFFSFLIALLLVAISQIIKYC